MKKILISMMTIALVAALIGGGVYAWFNDPETSSNNAFQAGTLDLTIDSGNTDVNMFTLTDKKPGDDDGGSPGTVALKNIGSITGDLTIATGAVTNTESTGTTGTADSGDTTTLVDAALTQADDYWIGYTLAITAGTNSGESRLVTDFDADTDTVTVASAFTAAIDSSSVYSLHTEHEVDGDTGEMGAELDIAMWLDVGGAAGSYDDGTDIGLKSDGNIYTSGALQFAAIDDYASLTWTDCHTGMAQNAEVDFYVEWQIDSIVENTIQGDSVSVGFTFTLEQA